MTGEIENGDLAVRDVADLLQHQYAIITGKSMSLMIIIFFFLNKIFCNKQNFLNRIEKLDALIEQFNH